MEARRSAGRLWRERRAPGRRACAVACRAASGASSRLLDFLVVDAFAGEAFSGNPAAVVLLEGEWPPDRFLAAVAAEFNLSETAFVLRAEGGGAFGLRWFTPTVEVDLCGHATLASAAALLLVGWHDAADTARFATRSGELRVRAGGDGGELELEFPWAPAVPATDERERWEAALRVPPGVAIEFVGRSTLDDALVVLDSPDAVSELAPDIAAVERLGGRGVIVTARAGVDGVDFVSRFFGPAAGIPEDPVTGSAHCSLAPYWRGQGVEGDADGWLRARQVSARGGSLRCRVEPDVAEDGDAADRRVLLRGRAVAVFKGTILEPPPS